MKPGDFQTFDSVNKIITFAPTLTSDVGNHTVSVTVTDGLVSPTYTFILTVIFPNLQKLLGPSFTKRVPKMINVPITTNLEYSLPITIFTDDMKIVHSKPLPKYATFEFPTYKFQPRLASDIGIVMIKGSIVNSYSDFAF